MAKPSQCDLILGHLKREGTITAALAMTEYDVYRLAARICDLRDRGHIIHTDIIETKGGARIAKYTLVGLVTAGRCEDWVR